MKQFLIDALEDYSESLGNQGCNDWSIPYTKKDWDSVERIFRYGIVNKLWDDGCPPTCDLKKIQWFDFAIVGYFKHAFKTGRLEFFESFPDDIHEKLEKQKSCDHDWIYHSDPSGNNDTYYDCSKCGKER